MIVQFLEVKRVACYARAETFTEPVASADSMVATPSMFTVASRCFQYRRGAGVRKYFQYIMSNGPFGKEESERREGRWTKNKGISPIPMPPKR